MLLAVHLTPPPLPPTVPGLNPRNASTIFTKTIIGPASKAETVAAGLRGGGGADADADADAGKVSAGKGVMEEEEGCRPRRDNAFLEFVVPGKVQVRHEVLHDEEAVGEGQVLVEAICSSISSGTELKVHGGVGGGGKRACMIG